MSYAKFPPSNGGTVPQGGFARRLTHPAPTPLSRPSSPQDPAPPRLRNCHVTLPGAASLEEETRSIQSAIASQQIWTSSKSEVSQGWLNQDSLGPENLEMTSACLPSDKLRRVTTYYILADAESFKYRTAYLPSPAR